MKWAKQYKKTRSNASHIMKRIGRKKEMTKRSDSKKEVVHHHTKTHQKKEEISSEKYFHICNGTPIRSIEELAMIMDHITDEEFSHHVTTDKNDFASWIEFVFDNKELAAALQPLKNKKDSQIALLKHLVIDKK
ncbi:MAG: hypothetical protein V1729_01495 [Candidatus Woesearchaeota archaeon]